MKSRMTAGLAALIAMVSMPWLAHAQSREDWVALGTKIHGGFGAFIPIGIRIGLDALERLNAKPRDVTVIYYDGAKAPCACIADGIMIATTASPGQRTLQIAADRSPEGTLAVVVVRHKQTGAAVRYTVDDKWMANIMEWNKALDPAGRYDAVMKAEAIFAVEALK